MYICYIHRIWYFIFRCFKCEKIPNEIVQNFFATLNDRCRLPGIFGRGAVQLKLDIFVPCFLVISCIYIATSGPYLTFFMLSFMPVFMLSFYYVWRKNTQVTRTKFFYSWGLASVVVMFLVFHVYTVCFRKILLWEHLVLFTAFCLMIHFFLKTKQRTGILHHGIKDAGKSKSSNHIAVNLQSTRDSNHDKLEEMLSQEISEKDVTWVDSRPIKGIYIFRQFWYVKDRSHGTNSLDYTQIEWHKFTRLCIQVYMYIHIKTMKTCPVF